MRGCSSGLIVHVCVSALRAIPPNTHAPRTIRRTQHTHTHRNTQQNKCHALPVQIAWSRKARHVARRAHVHRQPTGPVLVVSSCVRSFASVCDYKYYGSRDSKVHTHMHTMYRYKYSRHSPFHMQCDASSLRQRQRRWNIWRPLNRAHRVVSRSAHTHTHTHMHARTHVRTPG